MSNGLSNKITGQIGEYLVCAELGKRGYIATSFTGNVPEFDLIVIDDKLRSIPIQVKTTNSDNWPTKANEWMNIDFDDKNKSQIYKGNSKIKNPNIIFVFVSIGDITEKKADRFFILKKKELQKIANTNYKKYMNSKNWQRPKNYKSLDNRFYTKNFIKFENNWSLIEKELNIKKK